MKTIIHSAYDQLFDVIQYVPSSCINIIDVIIDINLEVSFVKLLKNKRICYYYFELCNR